MTRWRRVLGGTEEECYGPTSVSPAVPAAATGAPGPPAATLNAVAYYIAQLGILLYRSVGQPTVI